MRAMLARAPRIARRRGPAFLAAAAVNVLIIGGMAVSIHSKMTAPERAIEVWLVPAIQLDRKPKPVERQPPATQPRLHAPTATPPPTVAPSPIVIPPPAPVTLAPPTTGRWTVQPNGPGTLVDNPSPSHTLHGQQACSTGELEHLTTEERANCLQRWGKYMPKDDPLRHPILRDPDGSFGRAAAVIEDRRRPMRKNHTADCDLDAPGARMGVGCYMEDKPPR